MNFTTIQQFKEYVNKKNITVIGIGISNIPLIKFLAAAGAYVKACDKRESNDLGEVYRELKELGVSFCLGNSYLDDIYGDIIFKTPGMRFDVPELLEAKNKGAHITSEMEIFFDVCPSKIIAITGSDGKTTTTTLVSELLKAQGYKVWLGGNIGTPLLTKTEEMKNDDYVVLELSSFQLHTIKKSPHIAVITNITPNHLDMHKDYQEYIDAKKNIMLHQNSSDILIVNSDNEVTSNIGKASKGVLKTFSRNQKADIYFDGKTIYKNGLPMLNANDIKIPGMHNVENYMAAIAATDSLVDTEVIVKVAKDFGGVPHRIELVRVLDGVKYYNSSIDSSPNRTLNTLKVFKEKVILICGGKDKGIPYDDIGKPIIEHVKTLILIGATADKIEDAINALGKPEGLEIVRKDNYNDVVDYAHSIAKEGDIVLLSPASTSFDMFKNFEERGNLFKDLVNKLN